MLRNEDSRRGITLLDSGRLICFSLRALMGVGTGPAVESWLFFREGWRPEVKNYVYGMVLGPLLGAAFSQFAIVFLHFWQQGHYYRSSIEVEESS